MTAKATVFDRNGAPLAEITPAWETVSWRLNNVGLARFTMAYSDGHCTKDNLRPGNRLLVEFDNVLPDWGGVIGLPRRRGTAGVTVTAHTGAGLLGWRVTTKGRYFESQASGAIFQALIEEENAEWATGIEIGSVWTGGTARTLEFHFHDVLQRVRDLARLTGNDFEIEPVITDGVMGFRANWYERRGADKSGGVLLVEDRNMSPVTMDEQGPLANRVITVGEGSTWGSARLTGEAIDTVSRELYGYREYAEVQSASVQSTLDANAEALVDTLAYPRDRLRVEVIDEEPGAFDAYGIGDRVAVQVFLATREWYHADVMRVVAREWRPDNVCRLEVESWVS